MSPNLIFYNFVFSSSYSISLEVHTIIDVLRIFQQLCALILSTHYALAALAIKV